MLLLIPTHFCLKSTPLHLSSEASRVDYPEWTAGNWPERHTSQKPMNRNVISLITTSKQETYLKEKAARFLLIAFQLATDHVTYRIHKQQQTYSLGFQLSMWYQLHFWPPWKQVISPAKAFRMTVMANVKQSTFTNSFSRVVSSISQRISRRKRMLTKIGKVP